MSRSRRGRLLTGRAGGAVAGQLTQALAGFAVQVLAARALGASGLGVFALLYSGVVLATAVASGFVGDSLTVLDRSSRPVRAALQHWCLILAGTLGCAGALLVRLVGLLDTRTALLFGAAAAAFLLEDALRRLLMAALRFWLLPVVDGCGLLVTLAAFAWLARDGAGVADLLAGLLAGQLVAAAVAVAVLPRSERRLVGPAPAAMATVARYGRWRAGHRALRSTVLTAARLLVTVAVGAALYGELEAARIFVAPALLLVNGLGGYLLSTAAAARDTPLAALVRRADRFAVGLLAVTCAAGAAAVALAPVLGPLLTGPTYRLDPLAVGAWVGYAAATATVLPYGSLAAVRADQARLLGCRLLDAAVAVALVAAVMLGAGAPAWCAPWALAVGAAAGGVLVRRGVLEPLLRRPPGGRLGGETAA